MSIYVMSDIHGNLFTLSKMLKKIEFSNKDRLIIIGDIIDRGKYSLELLAFAHDKENVELLMGNHEYMMTNFYKSKPLKENDIWFINGGDTTFNQFEKSNSVSAKKKEELIQWVGTLPFKMTLEVNNRKFVLCHANPLANTDTEMVWDRIFPEKHNLNFDKETVYITGHTPVNAYISKHEAVAKWYYDKRVLDIDCGCAYIDDVNSQLCCIRLDDMKEFYVKLCG